MSKSFSIDIKQHDNEQEIIFSGELIINHINAIKEELMGLIDFAKPINMRLINPTGIDITFIQIVLAIKKAYQDKGINCKLQGTINEETFNLLANSGFKDLFKL